MTDDRFYERAGPFTLGEIAQRIGSQVREGDADIPLLVSGLVDLQALVDPPAPPSDHACLTDDRGDGNDQAEFVRHALFRIVVDQFG